MSGAGQRAVANRTQALVLGFFALVWVSLVAILAAAPEVYDRALRLPGGESRAVEFAVLAALSALIAVAVVGVLRRWRWVFWVIAVAFLAGILRVPATGLELAGVLPAAGPPWYAFYQALLGLMQFAIGLAMVAGYRRAGLWGDCRRIAGNPDIVPVRKETRGC